jgi:dolichol-phosphate mannosyltransferase
MELSVVLPALNEADNLTKLLPQLHAAVSALHTQYEIIVVDNHSTDTTAEVCAQQGAVLIQQTEPGFGGALWAGFARAQGEYVLTMDADLSHLPDFVPAMWARRTDADLVIASRYVPGGSADMPRFRYWLSVILNVVYTRILALSAKDISSGFRLYRAAALRNLDLRSHDFDAQEEILIGLYARACRIVEVPFRYSPRKEGQSKVRLFHFGLSYLRTLIRMWRLRNSIASADYDARAYDSVVPLQRYWQRWRFRIVLGMLDASLPALDIGCGSSRILGALGTGSVGVDVQLNKLRYSRRYGHALVNASTFALPFVSGCFGQVLCSQVIEHLPPGSQPFVEMSRVLEVGGTLVLGTPDYGTFSWRVLERLYRVFAPGGYADEHITHYTLADLSAILEGLGYGRQRVAYIGGGEVIASFEKADRRAST